MLDGARDAIIAAGGKLADTKLYILATAGMRGLTNEKQQAIYNSVNDYVKNYSFKASVAKTIPGFREGIYDWIAVNYLNHSLDGVFPRNRLGILDMGGASTEIAYDTLFYRPNTYSFHLGPRSYQIFSYSFLNLGNKQALEKLSQFGDSAYCYPQGYPYSADEKSEGRFSISLCNAATQNEVASFNVPQITGLLNPYVRYVAFSGYYYTFNFFNAGSSLAELARSIYQVCSIHNWSQLKAMYPKVPEKYLSTYCFNGVLTHNLLGKPVGYGFSQHSDHLIVANTVNNQSIDWPLGAAIYLIDGSGLNES